MQYSYIFYIYSDAMLQQYRASKASAKLEWAKDFPTYVVFAINYARQLGVPHLGDETTDRLGVNLFGILNEGGEDYGLSKQYRISGISSLRTMDTKVTAIVS